jgi:hypothetical protein
VVYKGDVLAVVWSIDVGSRKSDLVDALVQLRLDEQRLKARQQRADGVDRRHQHPLALLFAFSVLFFRGKSANLLSIGAGDFGIIVDSSVIMVENVYRHLSTGEHADKPIRERKSRAV